MNIALFTHHFLEPTHYAIAQLIGAMNDCNYSVYAKRFEDNFDLANVVSRIAYTKGLVDGLLGSRFDLVHAIYDGKTALRAHVAALESNLPFVLSFHGGFDTHAKIHDRRYREATREMANKAAAITVPSDSDVELLSRIGVHRAVTKLPVPVVISKRAHFPSPLPPRLLLVGRLIPKKGVDIALEAMSLLHGSSLDIVGDGELRADLMQLAMRLGVDNRVNFLGFKHLREVEELLARSFALLHPARVAPDGNADGTPQIVLMAQAMGVPVIAAASGNLSDVVEDGRSGLLVRPNDAAELASAVKRLVADDDQLLRLRKPAAVRERSIDNVKRILRDVYQDAMQSRSDK